mmetsp:Transcript_18377/g.29282  ORF Transcript_18377/g.29282 Transcript_18377/m.29282 type:complete len:179 (+) Transcript_18377:163-699(+)
MAERIGHTKQREMSLDISPLTRMDFGMYITSNQRHFAHVTQSSTVRTHVSTGGNVSSPWRSRTISTRPSSGYNRNLRKSGLTVAEPVRSTKGLVGNRLTFEDGLMRRIPKVQSRILKSTLSARDVRNDKVGNTEMFSTSHKLHFKELKDDGGAVQASQRQSIQVRGGFSSQCNRKSPF